MNLYSQHDERTIRTQRHVEDWTRSGLLTPEQRDRIVPELHVDVRRTNRFLRITLFLFGYLIVNSMAGLVAFVLGLGPTATAVLSLLAAAAFFAAAQTLVQRYRLYRFGIEEAAAVASASFFAVAAFIAFERFSMLQALIAATLASFVIFRRFGYVYAGIAATLFAAFVPLSLPAADTTRRLLAMMLMLTTFFLARREDHEWEFPGDAYALIEATAWAALYFIANLKTSSWISYPDGVRPFYWATYVLIWILPGAGLIFAIRDRHRAMLDVNIVLALVTMISNTPYLGAEQKAYDPILFGVMLVAVAIGLRRWMASGGGGSRNGFVAHRVLESEKARLAMAGTASVLVPSAHPAHTHVDTGPAIGGGGRSGGAGSSGSF
jgi:hypothetical protein